MAKAANKKSETPNTPAVRPVNLKELALSEFKKCMESPEYFILTYVWIQTTSGGRSKFQLYPFQRKLLHLMHTRDRIIILKSRQLGVTTLASAYALWLFLFKNDSSILCMAPTTNMAKAVMDKFKFAFEELPKWMIELSNSTTKEENQKKVVSSNGSKIEVISGAKNSARGKTASFLIYDEFAFVEDAEETYAAAQQTLATGGKCIVLSTPEGTENKFADLYSEAELGNNEYLPIKLDWRVHPEHTQDWRDRQDQELGKRLAKQECFEGDTRVYTKRGLKKISDIKTGDYVMTHTGEFKKVITTMSHVSDNLCTIYSSVNKRKRIVTNNHPFWENNEWVPLSNINNKSLLPSFIKKEHLINQVLTVETESIIKPQFFKVKYDGDFIYVNDRRHKKRFPKKIDIDYDFGIIIGLYLAEGSQQKNRITYSFNYATELNTWVQQITGIFLKKYNIEGKPAQKAEKSGNIDFNSGIFKDVLNSFVTGPHCYHKKLTDFAYDCMSLDFAKGILNGYFKGDGCLKHISEKSSITASEDLSYDIFYLFKIIGASGIRLKTYQKKGLAVMSHRPGSKPYYPARTYTVSVSNGRNYTCKDNDITDILDNRKNCIPSIEKDIDGITHNIIFKEGYKEPCTVYNLEVEDNHTYITEHFIVHNCDAEMISSGNTYFEPEDLDWVKVNLEEPVQMRGRDNAFWIWKFPEEVTNCAVILDTSRGDGLDYSTIQIVDLLTGDQIGEYMGDMGPKELANFAVSVCLEYNSALLIAENTGIGNTTCSYVTDSGYRNVYKSFKGDTTNVSQYLNKYMDEDKMTPGFTTSTSTRIPMLQSFKIAVEEKSIKIRSKRTYAEMRAFVWKGPKPAAKSGSNDDLLIPLAIGTYLRGTALAYASNSTDMQRACLGSIKSTTPQTVIRSNIDRRASNYLMPNPVTGEMEDYSWVLSS